MTQRDFLFRPVPGSEQVTSPGTLHEESVRAAILDTAKHMFARYSYEGTDLGTIAGGAGISVKELTDQFPDKISVLTAVFDEGWTVVNERLQDIVVNSLNARKAALTVMLVMVRILDHDGEWARLLLFESRRPHPMTREIVLSTGYRGFTRLCTDLVERGQKDGSFRTTFHPRAAASMLTGALESLLRDRYLAERQGVTTPLTDAQLFATFEALVAYLGPEKRSPLH